MIVVSRDVKFIKNVFPIMDSMPNAHQTEDKFFLNKSIQDNGDIFLMKKNDDMQEDVNKADLG